MPHRSPFPLAERDTPTPLDFQIKQVNEALGRAWGDELLRGVQDYVGRVPRPRVNIT